MWVFNSCPLFKDNILTASGGEVIFFNSWKTKHISHNSEARKLYKQLHKDRSVCFMDLEKKVLNEATLKFIVTESLKSEHRSFNRNPSLHTTSGTDCCSHSCSGADWQNCGCHIFQTPTPLKSLKLLILPSEASLQTNQSQPCVASEIWGDFEVLRNDLIPQQSNEELKLCSKLMYNVISPIFTSTIYSVLHLSLRPFLICK